MKQCMAGIAFALVALLVFAPVASAQSKWVRGTIVSVAGDTLVVKVAGNDMTFKVDKSTQLTARGAGKAQAAAEAKGAAGVKFADFAKAGQGVEVHYKDVGGVLTAIEVHSGLSPAEGYGAGGGGHWWQRARHDHGNQQLLDHREGRRAGLDVHGRSEDLGPGHRHGHDHQAVQGAGQVSDDYGPAGRERHGRRELQGSRRGEAGR